MVYPILSFLKMIINPAIVVLGIYVGVRLALVLSSLRRLQPRVEEELNGSRGKAVVDLDTLALRRREAAPSKRGEVDRLKNEFGRITEQYLAFSQTIPIFPLLGILGTVVGLILQVSTQDASEIYASLDLALTSTLYGLLAAIALKFFVAFGHTRTIYAIENLFREYEDSYRDAIAMQQARSGAPREDAGWE